MTNDNEDYECSECLGSGIDAEAKARAIASEAAGLTGEESIVWLPAENSAPTRFVFRARGGDLEAVLDVAADTVEGHAGYVVEQWFGQTV